MALVVATALLASRTQADAEAPAGELYQAAFALGDHLALVTRDLQVRIVRPDPVYFTDSVAVASDGRRIVYTSLDRDTEQQFLYLAAEPDFKGTRIGPSTGYCRSPSFSPAGDKVVFSVHLKGSRQRRKVNMDQAVLYEQSLTDLSRLTPLSSDGYCHHDSSWSSTDPDAVYYVKTDCQTSWRLEKKTISTGVETEVTDGSDRAQFPRTSPDGQRLAYVRITRGGADVMVRELKDTTTIRVAHVPDTLEPQPQWTADGRLLWLTGKTLVVCEATENATPVALKENP
jgi:Tol biopolymer transport system component